jgi:hypothetical protein
MDTIVKSDSVLRKVVPIYRDLYKDLYNTSYIAFMIKRDFMSQTSEYEIEMMLKEREIILIN